MFLTLLLALGSADGLVLQDPVAAEGWTIEKVSPPETSFPMFACLDEKGRLYVTESSGGDLYVELKQQVRKCKVRRYVDADGDGRYESSTVFADGLVPSMGLAWRGEFLYVADPPDLLQIADLDGDGKGDQRRVLVSGFGALDNGSLHGLTFGPDGMLYMTTGEPDGYSLPAKGGGKVTGTSGALLRCRPDGTEFEVVSRGFVNLIEVVFLPGGDMIGTLNWYQKPAGGMRDALVHLVEGGLFPYVPDKGTKHPVTGDPLPPLALFPAVALSGLAIDSRGVLYSAQFNARKVQRHVLKLKGSTYEATHDDLVTSENPDFHPSDVLVAPDGSLLVIDTGGWYVQHCPTGKIRKSMAPGGIWRLRPKAEEPAGPQVRREADASIEAGLWRLLPEPTESGFKELHAGLRGPHASAAARILGRTGERTAGPGLAALLSGKDPGARLAAAEGLARCGGGEQVPALLEALAEGPDAHLEHAIVLALHRAAPPETLTVRLRDESPRVRRAALVLLDQRPGGAPRDAVLAAVGSPDPALRRAALRILRAREDWAKEAAEVLRGWLEEEEPAERDAIHGTLLAFQADSAVQKVVAEALRKPGAARRRVLLDALAETTLPEVPGAWTEALAATLGDAELRSVALRTVAALRIRSLDERLEALARSAAEPDAVRLEAMRALRRAADPGFVVAKLADRADATGRLAAAEILRRGKLSASELALALRAIQGDPLVSPSILLPTLQGEPDDALLAALAGAIAGGWRPSDAELGPLAPKLPEAARDTLRKAGDEQREKLARFEPLLEGGDAARGREVFFGAAVACGKCHQVGADGGRVGPDLTKIGGIRSGRDLLESILVPSSTFAQGYESYVAATTSGDVLSGLLAGQSADAVVLRDAAGAEIPIRRDRLRDLKRAEKSVMPESLERALTPDQFRDLLAYLRSLR